MQFVVQGLDGTDPEAPARRQAVRPDHITAGAKLLESGNLWWGSALLDDEGQMKGSIYIVDFADRAELDNWLAKEPYVTGDVWREITIHKSVTNNPIQFSHDQDWFDKYCR